jgi:hydroxymethylpyrimidine/phosphomethylpyrimidine kinase
MSKITQRPVALTIAGSDSGGGAGIQADLKTFAAFGVHGASAVACLTAQNPKRVLAIEAASPGMLRRQIEAVFEELHPTAVKTGMLFSPENVRVVANFFRNPTPPAPARRGWAQERGKIQNLKLVVDPVMVSTSGVKLLQPAAMKILKQQLLPLATLVTPNLLEAEVLARKKIASLENMRAAAREIHERFGCATLVKGGHLRRMSEAVDIFFDGKTELLLTAPFIEGIHTHGTGCTYSAAITAALALGRDLPQAVKLAKNYITQAIAGSYRAGKHFALNHRFAKARPS